MSQYTNDIRKIAGTDRLLDQIKELTEKVSISGKRGTAYPTASGGAAAETGDTNSPLVQAAIDAATQGAIKGVSDALAEAISQGATAGGTGIDANLDSDGVYDAADIIDGAINAANSTLAQLNGLSGITEPYNGTSFTARLDGTYAPPTATTSSSVWPSLSSPPTYQGFQLGYYWNASSPAAAVSATPEQAAQEAIDSIKLSSPAAYPGGYGDAYWELSSLAQDSPTQWHFTWYQGPSAPPNTSNIARGTCSGGESYCPSTAPTYNKFPPNWETVLSLQADGILRSHEYDKSPMGNAYRNGVSTLVFKFGAGGSRYGVIEPTSDGNRMIYEVTSGGVATGNVRIYSMGKGTSNPFAGGTITQVTTPRTLQAIVPAVDIDKYRVAGGSNTFVRVGGVPF